jgi:hypothetical protein
MSKLMQAFRTASAVQDQLRDARATAYIASEARYDDLISAIKALFPEQTFRLVREGTENGRLVKLAQAGGDGFRKVLCDLEWAASPETTSGDRIKALAAALDPR